MNEKEIHVDPQDEIVTVRLPKKDYEVLRELIGTRQALSGFKKWLQTGLLWIAGSLLTVLGLYEIMKRY